MKAIKFLSAVMRPYRWAMIAAAGMGFLTSGSHLGLLMVSAYILAKAALLPPIAELQIAIAAVRLFGLTRGAFRYAERMMSHTLAFRLMSALRVRLYAAMESKPVSAIAGSQTAEWFSSFMHDVARTENFYIRILAPVLSAGLMWILSLFLFGMFDPLIALIVGVFMMINGIVIPVFVYRRSRRLSDDTETLKDSLTHNIMDWINGQADIRIAGQTRNRRKDIGELSVRYLTAGKRFSSLTHAHEGWSVFTMNLCVAATALYCMPLILSGEMNALLFPVILIGIMAGFESFHAIPHAAQHLAPAGRSAENLMLNVSSASISDKQDNHFQTAGNISWVFQHAHFYYPETSKPVFKGLTANVSGEGLTAVIGPSGCGKTTLLRMMLGYDTPQQGSLLIGGTDILRCDTDDLRQRISFCNQNPYVFSGTIRENILLGQPEATDEDMIRAAQEACIHERIALLPEGYDTHTGRHGYRLSGGERQRIALARALIKKSEILLLDEPSTHLDIDTESRIFRFLRQSGRYRAVIVVTHKIAWTEMADDIILLDTGKVIAQGNHALLMRDCPFYYEWFSQEQRMI